MNLELGSGVQAYLILVMIETTIEDECYIASSVVFAS